MNKYFYIFVLLLLLQLASTVSAQICEEVFPDAASNSSAAGDITFGWGSRVIGNPDSILETRDLTDGAGPNVSCSGTSCTQSGSLSTSVNYNTFPGGADVNVPYAGTQTLSPGNYNNLTMNSSATLTLSPGVYTFNGNIAVGYQSQIQLSAEGSVAIYVNNQVNLGTESLVNSSGTNRYLFLYARDIIDLNSNAYFNGVIYTRRNITFNNGSSVFGAVTSQRSINLTSASSITFDSVKISSTNFYGFCTSSVVVAPTPIAEWRLDENTWSGSANEINDSSANGLHGRSVTVAGVHPVREIVNPAVAGDPGTCAYGNFNGVNDGFLQIDDPGTGSILDLNTNFAVAVWLYPRTWATSDLMSIVSKDENFEFHLNGNGQVNWWWGGGVRELTTAMSVSTNQWHHVAISYTSGNQIIYLDGSVAATTNSTQAITLNNDPVLIGTDLGFNARNFDGYIDEVKIYNQTLSAAEVTAIMAETHICPNGPAIDHFVIDVGGGSASTCSPFEISIIAEDASNNTVTDYTGTISLTTSTANGDWSTTGIIADARGNLTPAANDSGSATYAFEATGADLGTIKLNLSNTHAENLTITINDSTNGVTSGSSPLSFSKNAFVVTAVDLLGNDVIANRSHNFQIEMYREDPATGVCSVATNYNVSDIKAWVTRSAADPGGSGPQISNVSASDNETLANTEPLSANFTLPFVNGVAEFSLLASDVGAYAINFLDDGTSFSDQDINGSTSTFVARPFGFAITVPGNPSANTAAGSVFTTAGSDFSVNVRAVGWNSADDVNNDGMPDGHDDNDPSNNANLADNSTLVSFGIESPTESVVLSAVLFAPAGGNDSGLASSLIAPADGRIISSFSGGAGSTSNVYFSEVGIIEIAANMRDGDYLGAGTTFSSRLKSQSSYAGRFVPAGFIALANSVTEACTVGLNYSYMDEAFTVNWQLQARNTFGNLVMNYEGGFAKLDASSGALDFGARDAVLPTPLSSRLTHNNSTFSWTTGTASVVSNLQIGRASTPDGPFDQIDIGVNAADADGIAISAATYNLDVDNDASVDHVNLGQTEVRFGRLRLEDAFGPETANLPVNFLTEYWISGTWVINSDDSCTAVALAAITYPGGTIDTTSNRTVTVGSGNSTGNYTSLAGSAVNFVAGNAGHYFSAPGANNMGVIPVDVDLTFYPWLRFDWNQDGNFSDSSLPTANYSFGSYRGHDRVIFWQEILK